MEEKKKMAQLEIHAEENVLCFTHQMFLSEDCLEIQKNLNRLYQVSLVSHAVRLPALREFSIVLRKQLELVNALYEKEVAPEEFCYCDVSYLDLNQIISLFALKWNSSLCVRLSLVQQILSVIFEEIQNVLSIELYIFYDGR